MKIMDNNGARCRVCGEATPTPTARPRASLPQERRSGTKRTDEDGVASVETGLAGRCRYRVAVWPTERLAPVEGIPTEGFAYR